MYKKLHTHEVSCPINVLSRNRSFVPGQYGPMEELLALRKNRGFSLTHGFVFLEELAVPDSVMIGCHQGATVLDLRYPSSLRWSGPSVRHPRTPVLEDK